MNSKCFSTEELFFCLCLYITSPPLPRTTGLQVQCKCCLAHSHTCFSFIWLTFVLCTRYLSNSKCVQVELCFLSVPGGEIVGALVRSLLWIPVYCKQMGTGVLGLPVIQAWLVQSAFFPATLAKIHFSKQCNPPSETLSTPPSLDPNLVLASSSQNTVWWSRSIPKTSQRSLLIPTYLLSLLRFHR